MYKIIVLYKYARGARLNPPPTNTYIKGRNEL